MVTQFSKTFISKISFGRRVKVFTIYFVRTTTNYLYFTQNILRAAVKKGNSNQSHRPNPAGGDLWLNCAIWHQDRSLSSPPLLLACMAPILEGSVLSIGWLATKITATEKKTTYRIQMKSFRNF